MSDDRVVAVGAAALGALAVLASLSPELDRVITTVVLALLVAGAVAGAVAYRVHVLRVRRDIEERGTTILRRERPPDRACELGRCGPDARPSDRRRRAARRPGHRRRLGRRRPRSPS